MSVETLNPSGVAAPLGHLSNATLTGRRLQLAGLVALDENGKLVGAGSMREQTLHVCRAIEQRVRPVRRRPQRSLALPGLHH